jgi:hypothetical protein
MTERKEIVSVEPGESSEKIGHLNSEEERNKS